MSAEHDGVSVAEAPVLDTFLRQGLFTRTTRCLIDKDELRVFDRYTPEFSFYCTESRVLDGPVGEAGGLPLPPASQGGRFARYAYEAHLKGEYARVCREAAGTLGAKRWALNVTIDTPPPDFPFEAIDECWFATVKDAASAFSVPAMLQVTNSLAKVCDMKSNITMLTRPTHRWPKQ